jgi:hypothetical protein
MKIRSKAALAAALAISVIGVIGFAAPANASPNAAPHAAPTTASTDGVLNPATYAGRMVVATPLGDVVVTVAAGQATEVAHSIQAGVANGNTATLNALVSPDTSCSTWIYDVATPFAYAASPNECAVFGYAGYTRQYTYANNSDITISFKGQGYTSTPAQHWYATCTVDGGDGCYHSVPWGNVLGTTRVEGEALSDGTGGAYAWLD